MEKIDNIFLDIVSDFSDSGKNEKSVLETCIDKASSLSFPNGLEQKKLFRKKNIKDNEQFQGLPLQPKLFDDRPLKIEVACKINDGNIHLNKPQLSSNKINLSYASPVQREKQLAKQLSTNAHIHRMPEERVVNNFVEVLLVQDNTTNKSEGKLLNDLLSNTLMHDEKLVNIKENLQNKNHLTTLDVIQSNNIQQINHFPLKNLQSYQSTKVSETTLKDKVQQQNFSQQSHSTPSLKTVSSVNGNYMTYYFNKWSGNNSVRVEFKQSNSKSINIQPSNDYVASRLEFNIGSLPTEFSPQFQDKHENHQQQQHRQQNDNDDEHNE